LISVEINETAHKITDSATAYITDMDSKGFSTDRAAEFSAVYKNDAKWEKVSDTGVEKIFKTAPNKSFEEFLSENYPDLSGEIILQIAYGVAVGCAYCEDGDISGAKFDLESAGWTDLPEDVTFGAYPTVKTRE